MQAIGGCQRIGTQSQGVTSSIDLSVCRILLRDTQSGEQGKSNNTDSSQWRNATTIDES